MIVKFRGGKELEAALKALDVSMARKRGITARALDKAAVPIRDEWGGGVDVRKGVLRRSIKIGNRVQTKATRKFKRGAGEDVVERFIGIDPSEDPERLPIYSVVEEFGDEQEAANPAGRQAWEKKKMESFDMIADAMWEEIEKVAKREARKAAKSAV